MDLERMSSNFVTSFFDTKLLGLDDWFESFVVMHASWFEYFEYDKKN